MTIFHQSYYWAKKLTQQAPTGTMEALSRALGSARVDLNPHQIEAALFALRSPFSRGVMLADEVGLGKTIEAGLVIAQQWAIGRRKILLILPAALRKQWQQEMLDKFSLPTQILDGKIYQEVKTNSKINPFNQEGKIIICSYHFAAAKYQEIATVPFDLVVLDEAHRLRNIYRTDSKIAQAIADGIQDRSKLLLTATPLQNSLLELYGIMNIIDPYIFGDLNSFKYQFVGAVGKEAEQKRHKILNGRIQSNVYRTLRSHVQEYIRFTERIPILQEFTPTEEEQELYEKVSNYLRRPDLIALPASQRQLITLVLLKLLSSSSYAIAGTLRSLEGRLSYMYAGGVAEKPIDTEDYESVDDLEDEMDMSHDPVPKMSFTAEEFQKLMEELKELSSYAEMAEKITKNAKGEALLQALTKAFNKAAELGAERKAVIFTESRRTQKYLATLLEENSYEDHVVLINGSNNEDSSRRIYEQWRVANKDTGRITGVPSADMRTALMEAFRDNKKILVATEAAAEGLNLQFCSLVVNYDLPWNPQRIEQRIGRCHRYGQKNDVVVVNFVNRQNLADQRVYELLSEKFSLFKGIFGASDEVLGALSSGVDIEKRIAGVYRQCRTREEIERSFDELQKHLEEEIKDRMTQTRRNVLEHFDVDIQKRLNVHRDQAQEVLGEQQKLLWEITRFELGHEASFETDQPRFHYQDTNYHLNWKAAEKSGDQFYTTEHQLAKQLVEKSLSRDLSWGAEGNYVIFHFSKSGIKISELEKYKAQSGWLELSKLTVSSTSEEDYLILTARTEKGETLNEDLAEKMLMVPAEAIESQVKKTPPVEELTAQREARIAEIMADIEARNMELFETEASKLEEWADDLKVGLEREIKNLDGEIKEARRAIRTKNSLAEKIDMQKQIKELESKRNEKRRNLFDAQDEIEQRRDRLIKDVEGKVKSHHKITPLWTIWWIVG